MTGEAGSERAEHLQNNTQVADGLIAFEQIAWLRSSSSRRCARRGGHRVMVPLSRQRRMDIPVRSYGSSELKATIGFMRSAGIPENRSTNWASSLSDANSDARPPVCQRRWAHLRFQFLIGSGSAVPSRCAPAAPPRGFYRYGSTFWRGSRLSPPSSRDCR